MTDRICKIDEGTIGSNPCEVTLNEILIRLNDVKITRIIMGRHQDLKIGLKKLVILATPKNRGFARRMMKLLYDDIKGTFMLRKDDMPKEAFTYALCCFTVVYRESLKETQVD